MTVFWEYDPRLLTEIFGSCEVRGPVGSRPTMTLTGRHQFSSELWAGLGSDLYY